MNAGRACRGLPASTLRRSATTRISARPSRVSRRRVRPNVLCCGAYLAMEVSTLSFDCSISALISRIFRASVAREATALTVQPRHSHAQQQGSDPAKSSVNANTLPGLNALDVRSDSFAVRADSGKTVASSCDYPETDLRRNKG